MLEKKYKIGQAGGKEKTDLGKIGTDLFQDQERSIHSQRLPFPLQEVCSGLIPTLYNRYQRYYFLSYNQRMRMTVDTDITFARPEQSFRYPLKDHIVVEFKYLPEDQEVAQSISQQFPWRIYKYSKYITGMNLLY